MIVKNEAHIIKETLQSVSKYIDYYVISDTGSTDGTQTIIKKYFDSINIQGEIHQDEWRDFGYNRSLALKHCSGKGDYAFVIDADDLIMGNLVLPENMTADSYMLKFGKGFEYMRQQIFKIDRNYRYIGVLHEYPTCDGEQNIVNIDGNYYINSRRLGSRNLNVSAVDKYKRDAEILLKALETEPNNVRYVFYLAQSYKDSNQNEKAIEYYNKRVSMGGWDEEIYYSLLQIPLLKERIGTYSKNEIKEDLLRAFFARSSRIESLYHLSRICNEEKSWYQAIHYCNLANRIPRSKDKLFCDNSIYNYKLEEQAGITLYYLNDYQASYKVLTDIMRKIDDVDIIRKNEFNVKWSVDKISKTLTDYSKEQVNNITQRLINPLNKQDITITITSCKRLDLFMKTINSFMNCCSDISVVKDIICIDDNSTLRDKVVMQKLYPFVKFVFKNEYQKGHAKSMNWILDNVKTKYILHLEDDWQFFMKDNYITKALSVLEKDNKMLQIVFNRNYANKLTREHIDFYNPDDKIHDNIYINHNYIDLSQPEKWNDFAGKHPGKKTNVHWYGLSFNPSIINLQELRKNGRFDETDGIFFEKEFAKKCFDNGYKVCFMKYISSIHIGDGDNAYKLNGMKQF